MATRRDQAQLDADTTLRSQLSALKLPFMLENYQAYAQTAADKHWSHLDYLTELLGGEASARAGSRCCASTASRPSPQPPDRPTIRCVRCTAAVRPGLCALGWRCLPH